MPQAQNEVFVKALADHIHSVKYKMASTGEMKTMQELGFHYVNM
eukprot:COSAG05_NODE_2079_length_3603_cov_2.777968_7_plen_44_part_00